MSIHHHFLMFMLNDDGIPVLSVRVYGPGPADAEVEHRRIWEYVETSDKGHSGFLKADRILFDPSVYPVEATKEEAMRYRYADYVFDHENVLTIGEHPWPYADIINVSYRRKPGTTGHALTNFTRGRADWRPTMLELLSEYHSADVRADLQVYELIKSQLVLSDLLEGELIRAKGALREDNPADQREMGVLAVKIAKLRVSKAKLETDRVQHFRAAARVTISEALIHGHGIGFHKVHPEHYYYLADRLVNLLVAATGGIDQKEVWLNNMDVNLRSDHDRTGFDRLVATTPTGDVDLQRLYSTVIKTPPQFGTAPTGGASG